MDERGATAPETVSDRDRLILDHVPLLRHVVGRLAADLPAHFDREDLLGFGMLGLIGAADSWDPSRGLKFSTYAYHKIRGAILDELRRLDFLPRGRREKVRELDRVVCELEQERGVAPTPEEIAERMGLAAEEVDSVLATARLACAVSLDDGPSAELASLLRDPRSDDPVGSAEWEETKRQLARAIAELPEQEKTVVTLYYAEELFLKEIGDVLGVTESRASQIHGRALYRLSCALAEAVGR